MVMFSNDGAYPVPALPFRVRRINGLTYTSEAVAENLEDETNPWFEVSDPPAYDASTHTLSWDGADWVVSEIVRQEPQASEILSSGTIIFASGPDEIAGNATGDAVLAGSETPDGV